MLNETAELPLESWSFNRTQNLCLWRAPKFKETRKGDKTQRLKRKKKKSFLILITLKYT